MAVKFDYNICIFCAGCVSVCPRNALVFTNMRTEVDKKQCNDCGICVRFCPVGAIRLSK